MKLNKAHLFLKFFSSLLFCLYGSIADAKVILILDFDGTLVDDSRNESLWKTPWVLKKVDSVTSSAQLSDILIKAPQTIEVSYAEFIELQALLAKDRNSLGNLTEVPLMSDAFLRRPKTIIPGYYRVDEDTFKFYKTGLNGENYLLQNYQEAKARVRNNKLNPTAIWGEAFPLLQKAMSDTATVGDVHIFTARDQSPEEFEEFFKAIQTDGLIENVTGYNKRGAVTTPTIHQLQGFDSILYGRTLGEAKKNVVEKIARNLAFGGNDLIRDYAANDPDKIVETHTIIVAEDDPANIKRVGEALLNLSSEHTIGRIKFVILNTAPEDVVLNSAPPFNRRWIVIDEGFTREASGAEVNNYMGRKSLSQKSSSGGKACNLYLGGK